MLSGESGTGKEVFARYIHQHSPRAKGPSSRSTVRPSPRTCSGHALRLREGRLRRCAGGATGQVRAEAGHHHPARRDLEMPLGLQDKLLRVLLGARGRLARRQTRSRWPRHPRARHQQPRHAQEGSPPGTSARICITASTCSRSLTIPALREPRRHRAAGLHFPRARHPPAAPGAFSPPPGHLPPVRPGNVARSWKTSCTAC